MLFSKTRVIFISTAFKLTASKGNINPFELGNITPFPTKRAFGFKSSKTTL